ncbi:MAG TPA: RDD family protein [Niabella sp.]|nr:RDD family protein [Niabella sp.]
MNEPTTPYNYQGESNLFNEAPPVIYAGFWERFAAVIIDGIILWIIGYFIGMIMGTPSSEEILAMSQSEGFSSTMRATYFSGSNMASLVVQWLYSALMVSGPWQATLGKRAVGIKVTGMNGERISFLNATGRFLATFLSFIIVLIGYLMMLWDDKKQTLHDKLAGTLVVKGK